MPMWRREGKSRTDNTHHGRGTCDADGRGRDADHGEPSAHKGQFLRVLRRLKEHLVWRTLARLGGG
jgi:hypothetical protein